MSSGRFRVGHKLDPNRPMDTPIGSNKKSSVGACKSYCMNFDSFKIVDSSLP